MLKGLRHVGLVVEDIDKALYFYKDLLGFSIDKDAVEMGDFIGHILGIPDVKVRTIKMRGGNEVLLELLYFDKGLVPSLVKPLTERGFTHMALTVKDLDQLYGQLKKTGVSFVSSPQVSADGCAKVVFCRDFEGNYVELVEEVMPRRRDVSRNAG